MSAGGKGANSKMMGQVAGSKPDRIPAPNVAVNPPPPSLGGEAIIQTVAQQQMMGQQEQEMHNNMMALYSRQRPKMEMGGVMSPEMTAQQMQQPGMYVTQQRPMSMMTIRQSPAPGGYSQPHPQLMRAQPAQQYTPQGGFRTTSYPQSAPHMVSHGQMYSQQTHQSPQLSRMLSRPPVQTYQAPPNPYSQMAPQPVGPPPQYVARMHPQPQTAGYPHMLGHPHPQQMQGPMSQTVGPHMGVGHAHQYGAPPHSMQMDHGVHGGDPSFMYNGQQQQTAYPLNTNNNSNNLSQAALLTPAERLSSLSELL